MSGAKHTDGPWKWHPKFIIGERNGSVYAEPNEGHAYAIAMQPRYVSDGQWAADARLIAAAPDLLRCQTMGASLNTPDFLDWIADRLIHVYGESENIDFVLSLRDRAKAARAAIAAATGANHER